MKIATDFRNILLPAGMGLATTLVLLLFRNLFFRLLRREPKRSVLPFREMLPKVFAGPSLVVSLAIGLHVGIDASDMPARYANEVYRAVYVILILTISLAVANLSAAVFQHVMESSHRTQKTTGLSVAVIKGIVLILGGLLILSFLGISIAPLLTALGVGGLAVALALKETLENLFAGLYLVTDQTIRVGDWVKLEGGQVGRVDDIGWRTTRIFSDNNNTVILPNSRISQSIVVNYSLPDERVAVSIVVPAGPEADPQKLEQILLEVARKGSEDIVGLMSSPEPVARFTSSFNQGNIEMTLYFNVRKYNEQSFVQHELRKRAFKKFHELGIPMARMYGAPEPEAGA